MGIALTSDNGDSINNRNDVSKSDGKLIELTCTPEKYGSSEYLIIDASKKLIFDNGEKTENVYIDKNRIIFETNDGGSKFVSRIDRTTGKMVSTEPKNPGINLNYSCELVNPKF